MAQPDLKEAETPGGAEDGPGGWEGDRGVRYRVLAVTCALAVLAYLHRVGSATAAPELKAQTGLTDRDLSYLMAVFMASYGLVEVPFGLLADRLGVRHALAVLVLAWSVLTGAVGLVLHLPAGT